MTRKPVLGWEKAPTGDKDWQFKSSNPFTNAPYYLYVDLVANDYYKAYVNGAPIGSQYESANAAKLACEDHLATVLEPLAQTYDILKENKK